MPDSDQLTENTLNDNNIETPVGTGLDNSVAHTTNAPTAPTRPSWLSELNGRQVIFGSLHNYACHDNKGGFTCDHTARPIKDPKVPGSRCLFTAENVVVIPEKNWAGTSKSEAYRIDEWRNMKPGELPDVDTVIKALGQEMTLKADSGKNSVFESAPPGDYGDDGDNGDNGDGGSKEPRMQFVDRMQFEETTIALVE
jgi:hypothetical protein